MKIINPKFNFMVTIKKLLNVFFLNFICLLTLITWNSCNNNDNRKPDCSDVKNWCINYVNSNKDEIREIILRQMKRDPNDDKITWQRISEYYKEYKFSKKLEENQNFLKEYCPQEYDQYSDEMVVIVRGEILKGSN